MRKDHLQAIVIIVLFYLFLEMIGITCPIKFLTGISCAGCGMSRAYLSLLRLDFKSALHDHPLFIFPILGVLLFLFRKKISIKRYHQLLFLMGLVMLGVYVIRLMNPNDSIVVFEPKNGLIYKIINLFQK